MLGKKEIIRFTVPLLLKCNLKCKYCHVPNEKNEYLDLNLFEKALIFFFSSNGKQKDLVLYGGEPFLLGYDRLKKIFEILNRVKSNYNHKNIIVTIVSNLTILNSKIEKLLENVDCISVSIDGEKESHNINRGLFDLTYKNLKTLLSNEKLKGKLSLNKVVNKNNVNNFFKDVVYLNKEFNLDIYYNGALTVGDWDEESIILLENQIEKIYFFCKNNNILRKFGNFFRIPFTSCPFGTLSLSLDGKIYNCEFMANDYINTHGHIIDLKNNSLNLDIGNCFYNLNSERCLRELCMGCGTFCTKFSFQNGKFLNTEKINILKKVKSIRFNHLKYFKLYIKNIKKLTLNIEINNVSLEGVFKIYNFLYSLNKMLGVKIFNLNIKDKKEKIIIILLNRILLKSEININVNFDKIIIKNDLIIDLDSSYAYDKDLKFLGNINSEIYFFK